MPTHKNRHIFQLSAPTTHPALLALQNYLTCAEIRGESYKGYRMKLSPLEQKVSMNIQLGVIYAAMVDFCRPCHKYYCYTNFKVSQNP